MAINAYNLSAPPRNIYDHLAPHIEATVKPISVKEAAEALGCSTRSVQYKLQNGDLKGIQQKNQYGVKEWRVWPTKEISDKISAKNGQTAMNFSPEEKETVRAEDVFVEEEAIDSEPTDWQELDRERMDLERERMEMMAQALVKPLTERIEAQAVALRDQERLIEDQSRQLRLLPDLQKQAEHERKAAELKELEAEALRKQIAAIQQTKDEADRERVIAEQEILRLNAEKDAQIEAIQKQADEGRRAIEAEMQRLKEEKETEAKAVQEQLQTLAATVQELQKPKPGFWQKFFGVRET
jgi:chemotaxis protein histidine kinase CheA